MPSFVGRNDHALTIVIPTHNRQESLRRTLLSLEDQVLFNWAIADVIVVADGCRDGTVPMLEMISARLTYRLHWLNQDQSGPAAARNRAVRAATGEIIVFLDDDVVPAPVWLASHYARHQQDERAVVIGPLSPGDPRRPAWVRWEDRALQHQYQAMLNGEYGPTPRQFYTGNSSVRRRWIIEAGGFDAQFKRAEDIELAYRLQDMGLHFYFDPTADGLHHSFRTYQAWRSIPGQYGRNDVIMAMGRGRDHLLRSIAKEFHERQGSTRALARVCLGRLPIMKMTLDSLGYLIQISNRLGLDSLSMAACSAVWNLSYWQGLADALGGSRCFWQLVRGESAFRPKT